MNKLVEEIIKPILEANSNIKKVVGIYGGRFQPFGPHHLKTYKWLQKQVDEAYITTSNIKKPPRHPMNFKEKVRHMTKMGIKSNRIIEEKSPYVAKNLEKKYNKETTAFVYVFGAKDAGRLGGSGKYFQDYKKNKNNLKGYGEHGYYLTAPHVSIKVGGKEVSGTTMRELLGSDKFDDNERKKLFKKMFRYFDNGLYNMMTNKFKKIFESVDHEDTMIWEPSSQKEPKKWQNDKKKRDLIKGQNEDTIGGGYPSKKELLKKLKKLKDIRNNLDSNSNYQFHPVHEDNDDDEEEQNNTLDKFHDKALGPGLDLLGLVPGVGNIADLTNAGIYALRGKGTDALVSAGAAIPAAGQLVTPVKYISKLFRNEAINLPVEIGDTILMGKFKNKKVVIKTIDFNEKGDLLINGRPALKFRMLKEFFENLNMKAIIKEATSTATSGGGAVDDGHTFGFGGIDSYVNIGEIQAKKLGFKIVDFIMKTPTDYEPDTPEYANDGAVSYGPAGVGTGRTPNNQIDLTGGKVWTAWEKYIDKIATTSGMKFVDYLLDKDIIVQTARDSKDMVKTRNQENPTETPERKYVEESTFSKEWWKDILSENIMDDKLLEVANFLTKKYGVNVKIKLLPKLKNDEYAYFDFDKRIMFISKKSSKDLNQFLISVLHEIDHAKDLKKMGRRFIKDYEKYQNLIAQGHIKGKKDPYWDNPYEIKAEKFGRKEARKYNVKKLFSESLNEVSGAVKMFKQRLMRRGIKIRYDKAAAEKDLIQKYGGKGRVAAKKFGLRKAFYAVPDRGPSGGPVQQKPTIKITPKEMEKLHKDKVIDKGNLRVIFSEGLLLEGGAYGHMAHPFDDKDLTFGDLKKIITLGLGGQLSREDNVTEKLDGQNIMISWKDGKLIAARNKGHIKNGGATALDTKGIASKFAGRGEIKNAFVFAMKDLEKAIKSLSDKQKDKIFNNGYNFMNMEVMWPKSANVIDYDKAELVFHGALKYDDSGNVKGEVSGSGRILAGMIQQVNQDIQKKYKIGKPVFLQVPKHQDFGKMKSKFLNKLKKLQSEFRLKDNDTLGLYHQRWWENFIIKKAKIKLPVKVLKGLTKRWAFFDKKYSIPMIKNDIKDEKFLEWVLSFDKKNHQIQVKENMKPFEVLFFEVGAEILKNVQGFMAANPDKAVQNMRKKLSSTISKVKSGGDIKKLKTLKLQLDKLNAIGGTKAIVPSEGIVFKYKGKTYKFTGAFAPINQITGLINF